MKELFRMLTQRCKKQNRKTRKGKRRNLQDFTGERRQQRKKTRERNEGTFYNIEDERSREGRKGKEIVETYGSFNGDDGKGETGSNRQKGK